MVAFHVNSLQSTSPIAPGNFPWFFRLSSCDRFGHLDLDLIWRVVDVVSQAKFSVFPPVRRSAVCWKMTHRIFCIEIVGLPGYLIMIYLPIGSMYAIYGNIDHQYTPNVSIYTIHGSYGYDLPMIYLVIFHRTPFIFRSRSSSSHALRKTKTPRRKANACEVSIAMGVPPSSLDGLQGNIPI